MITLARSTLARQAAGLALLLACAPHPPAPAPVTYHYPLADRDCPVVPPRRESCLPDWDTCPPAIAACSDPAQCLAALAEDPGHCQTHAGDDADPDACIGHVADIIAAGGPPPLDPVLDNLSQKLSLREPLLRALERVGAPAIEALAQSRHPVAIATLVDLAARERRPLDPRLERSLRDPTLAIDPDERTRLEQHLARRRALAQALAGRADEVIRHVLVDPRALAPDVTEWLRPALTAAPDSALAAIRERLPCAAGRVGEDERLLHLAVATPTDGRTALLRDLLDWPDWQLQRRAGRHLAELGSAADLQPLRALANTHWSRLVRGDLHLAAEAIAGDPAARRTLAASDRERRLPGHHDDEGCFPDDERTWTVRFRGQMRMLAFPVLHRPEVPPDAPRIRLELPDLREPLPLPERASAILRMGDIWLYGVHKGEFGGGLIAVDAAGMFHMLRDEPVVDILATPSGVIALLGLDHLVARGLVVAIEPDVRTLARARFLARLPAAPWGGEIEPDGTVLIPTRDAVIAMGPTGAISLVPCAYP